MRDSNVGRLVTRDEGLELLARAKELPEVQMCADCGAGFDNSSARGGGVCTLCYANRLFERRKR